MDLNVNNDENESSETDSEWVVEWASTESGDDVEMEELGNASSADSDFSEINNKFTNFLAHITGLQQSSSEEDDDDDDDTEEDKNMEDKSADENEDKSDVETCSMSSFDFYDDDYYSARVVGQQKKIKISCCTLTWKIKNFSKYLKTKKRDFIRSPPVDEALKNKGINYYVHLHPKGSSRYFKDYISLSISCYYRSVRDRMMQYELSILDKEKRQVHKKKRILFNTPRIFWRDVDYNKFLNRKWLMDNKDELLPNDCLTLVLKINWSTVKENYKHSCHCLNNYNYKLSNSSSNLEFQFDNPEYSDVKLITADKQTFHAHKIILAAKSPVFSAMFKYSCMQENKDSIVSIEDFSSDVVREMLRFIYCGTISQINQIDQQIFYDLIQIADKYDIDGLENLSELEIKSSICVDNAMSILISSDTYNAINLRRMALDFISLKLNQMRTTEDFKSAETSHPNLIRECTNLENQYSDCKFRISNKDDE